MAGVKGTASLVASAEAKYLKPTVPSIAATAKLSIS